MRLGYSLKKQDLHAFHPVLHHHLFSSRTRHMFNTLLKKASESSFAAMASEAMDSRPGSPATTRRPPGSPLAQPAPGSPARKVQPTQDPSEERPLCRAMGLLILPLLNFNKPRNTRPAGATVKYVLASGTNRCQQSFSNFVFIVIFLCSPHSSNAQLASQLDEAYNDIESFQKLLQKAAQEKSQASDPFLGSLIRIKRSSSRLRRYDMGMCKKMDFFVWHHY